MNSSIQLKSIILTLFLLLFIAACNEEAPEAEETSEAPVSTEETTGQEEVNQSSVQFVPLVDDENGIALQYPANWISHSALGGVTVASSQSVVDAESMAEIGDDAFVVIIPGEIDVFNFQTSQTFSADDIVTALDTYKVLLEKEGQAYVVVEPPQAFDKDDQKMARMVLRSMEGGQPIITVMAVIMAEDYMALVSAASHENTAEEIRPVFYQIIDSIIVRPPTSIGIAE